MPLCSGQKLNGEVVKGKSQTHGNAFHPVKGEIFSAVVKHPASVHLYFVAVQPGDPTDKFNFR